MVDFDKAPPPPAPKVVTTTAQPGEKYIVRFPDGMRERIAEAAKGNNRSMNAEIVARLESTFTPGEPVATKSQLERVFKKIAEQQDHAMMAVTLVRDMLGSYVVQLADRLPPAERSKGEVVTMRQLARAAIDMDAEGMKAAAAKMMAASPGFSELGDAEGFFDYLGRVNKSASERRRKIIEKEDGQGEKGAT